MELRAYALDSIYAQVGKRDWKRIIHTCMLRIPDGIVFINGIPVVVLEFKSAVKENTTIMDNQFSASQEYNNFVYILYE